MDKSGGRADVQGPHRLIFEIFQRRRWETGRLFCYYLEKFACTDCRFLVFSPALHGHWPLGGSSAGHYRMDNVQHKGTTRYNAKGMAKPVNFLCIAPEAQEVAIIGDFNNWESGKHLMNRQIDGSWSAQIDLHHGHHRYHRHRRQPTSTPVPTAWCETRPTSAHHRRQLGQLPYFHKRDAPHRAPSKCFSCVEPQPLAASNWPRQRPSSPHSRKP